MTIRYVFVTQPCDVVIGTSSTWTSARDPFGLRADMTHTTLSTSARLRRTLRTTSRVGVIALVSFGTAASVAVIEPGTVQAQSGPVNELAPEITASAALAVAAYDAYRASGSVADELNLAWHRAVTARYTALELGYDELAMIDAWSAAPLEHQGAVLGALTQVGVPYRTNTSEAGVGFDCSGLTTYAWATSGVDLYRQSGTQIAEAARVTRDTAQAGDLVHYPGHIMLYLGVDDAIVHSVQTGRTVEVDTISSRRRDSVSWGNPNP
jgi:cell wall-associated NlpC family hydrolase